MLKFEPKKHRKESANTLLSFRATLPEAEQVDAMAQSFGLSRAEFMRQAVEFAVKHMLTEDDKGSAA